MCIYICICVLCECLSVCVCMCLCIVCACLHICLSVCVCVYLISQLAELSVPGLSLMEKQLALHQPAQSSHSKICFKLFREQSCV